MMNRTLPKLDRALVALALLLPVLAHADAGNCKYVPIAKLPITYSDATHRAIIPGAVNGKPVRMIVDTGAWSTVLFRPAAERLGLSLAAHGYSNGIGGTSVTYRSRVDDLMVGNLHSGKVPIDVIGNSSFADGDVLVGADFLLQADMELSLADNYLQFFRASGCDDTYLAYWDSNAMEIPFAGKDGHSNKPMVKVKLNGVELTAILDTGAPLTSVTRSGAERAGIRLDGPGVRKVGTSGGIGDERVDAWFADFDSFSIGQETVKHVGLRVREESSRGHGQIDMLLGADFLRVHRILFAMSQNRFYMSYLGGDPFPARPRMAAQAAH